MNRRQFLALVGAGAVAQGCFGSFPALRAVYGFNQGISGSKFVQWLVFLGLCIIPVYEIAGLIDVLILNSIEFWGLASNDTPDGDTRVVELEHGGRMRLRKEVDAGLLHVEVETADRTVAFTFDMNDVRARVLSGSNVVATALERADGAVEVRSGRNLIQRFEGEEVASLLESHAAGGARGAAAWAHRSVTVEQLGARAHR